MSEMDGHRASSGVEDKGFDAEGRELPGMIDGLDRVRGRAPFTIDVRLPGMLHAKLVRSTAAHAKIVRIDTSAAERVPGVVAVLTGEQIAAMTDIQPKFGPVLRDQPILAMGKVRFVGEPVVAIAAVDEATAAAAAELVEIEYEELEPVFDSVAALAADAPIVHEEPPHPGPTFADVILNTAGGTNLCNHFKLRRGDIEQGFREAVHIFEDEFTSPAVSHMALETHVCVAQHHGDGITIHVASQIPFMVRSQLAEIFGLPSTKVRVIIPTLGGGYGGKCYPNIEPIATVLSRVTNRPVRLQLTREEDFVTITKHAVRIRTKTGLRADGTIVARKTECFFDTGAYADIGPRLIKNGGYGTAGPTDIPHVWIDSYAVYTNHPPAGAYRGYGISQAAWSYETQADMIAERLGMDALEFRMKNLLVDGQHFATGEPAEDVHFKELLQDVADRVGYHDGYGPGPQREGSKVRAKGLSAIIKGTITPSTSTATAKMNEDGTVDVAMSSVEMGQGIRTSVAILAAERLSLPVERIQVSHVDTQVTPYDQQTSASRSANAMGVAVMNAADEIAQQVREIAAELFEVAPGDLELRNGKVQVVGSPDKSMTYGQLMTKSRAGSILGRGRFSSEGGLDPQTGQGRATLHWHQAVGAAEVEVDLETGKVEVLRYEAGVWAGRVINPVQAALQAEGNVAFGLGQALFEEMVYDGGQLQNGNLGDYMVSYLRDMPKVFGTKSVGRPDGEIHGIGETGLPAVMPAICNAISRATGVRITSLPATPEKILRGLRERAGQPVEAEA